MTLSAQTPRKPRRRWLFIVLAGFVGMTLLTIIVFKLIFVLNSLPDEKLDPPREFLKEMRDLPLAQAAAAPTPIPDTYLELVGAPSSDPRLIRLAQHAVPGTSHPRRSVGDRIGLGSIEIDNLFVDGWKPGHALSEAQLAWLSRNQSLIDGILAFAAEGGPPPIPLERAIALDVEELLDKLLLPCLDMTRVLSLHARRRLDVGDPDGAARAQIAVYQIAMSVRDPLLVSHLWSASLARYGHHFMVHWIESDMPPPPDPALRMLAAFENYPLKHEKLRTAFEIEYLTYRHCLVEHLNGPFVAVLKNRLVNVSADYAVSWREVYKWSDWRIGSVPETTQNVLAALGNALRIKTDPEAVLDDYDRAWQANFERFDRDASSSGFKSMEDELMSMEDAWGPITTPARTRFQNYASSLDLAEARHNLILAALARIAEIPDAPLPRDPFTRAPLTVIAQPDGATTFYSLGPDLADQRGALAYDPTNGTISPGDIALRLPPR